MDFKKSNYKDEIITIIEENYIPKYFNGKIITENNDIKSLVRLWENNGIILVEKLINNILLPILLQKYNKNIDDYVENFSNNNILSGLGLYDIKDGMLSLNNNIINLKRQGIIINNDKLIYPHQFFRRNNSGNFLEIPFLLLFCIKKGLRVYLKIDPFRITESYNYFDIIECDYWHGPKFSESLLESKDKEEKITIHNNQDFTNFCVFRTSMKDKNNDTERQFMIEEFLSPDEKNNSGEKYYIQKFLHFVYNNNKKNFIHIDGAIRTFSKEEYEKIYSNLKNGFSPDNQIGIRNKLFLVEGEFDFEIVEKLTGSFFRGNELINEYFNF